MVLFDNATIEIASKSSVKNDEGTIIDDYSFVSPLETLRADVQPNTLTEEQIELYGINSRRANTKKAFFESAEYMNKGNRARVTFDNGKVADYDIQPVNEWNDHSEVLLIPVENE